MGTLWGNTVAGTFVVFVRVCRERDGGENVISFVLNDFLMFVAIQQQQPS